jgi:hypothetical protein
MLRWHRSLLLFEGPRQAKRSRIVSLRSPTLWDGDAAVVASRLFVGKRAV